MELSPLLYHWFVRPTWMINRYNRKLLGSLLHDFDLENKSILDFGCGVGSNCFLFESKNYTGIDISSNRINYAKKLHKDYFFSTLENDSLPFEDKKFDYIFVMAVLHHIPPKQIPNYLQEFRRVLSPTGNMLIIEPCIFENKPFNNWCMCFFDKGKYISTEDQYLTLFRQQQFQTDHIKKFHKGYLYNEIFFTASPN